MLEEAAQLAAYHSKARDSAQVPVDYCAVRYVKKPAGAKPGMVIFSNQHTLYVKPEQQCVDGGIKEHETSLSALRCADVSECV